MMGTAAAAQTASALGSSPATHPTLTPPASFYDAGDHLKLNFPLAHSLALLAWGLLEFPAGYAAAGQAPAALDNLRWVGAGGGGWGGGGTGTLRLLPGAARRLPSHSPHPRSLSHFYAPTHPPAHLSIATPQGADYLMACHASDDAYIAQIGNPGPGGRRGGGGLGRPVGQRCPRRRRSTS